MLLKAQNRAIQMRKKGTIIKRSVEDLLSASISKLQLQQHVKVAP